MNIYLIVEGNIGEKAVYSSWIPFVNPSLNIKNNIQDVQQDDVFIISGGGYPNYYEIIENGIEDVKYTNLFDRIVIAIDSEEMSYIEKQNEITNFLINKNIPIDCRIIIQHFCLETWALGNRIIIPRNPKSVQIKIYRKIFDVLVNDPELLPRLDSENLNRSQFAEKYLRVILNDKYKNLTYNKSNVKTLLNKKFFDRVTSRHLDTNHISSFANFLNAFI
jgi:hypothetical protein